jgi:hypothetical protein
VCLFLLIIGIVHHGIAMVLEWRASLHKFYDVMVLFAATCIVECLVRLSCRAVAWVALAPTLVGILVFIVFSIIEALGAFRRWDLPVAMRARMTMQGTVDYWQSQQQSRQQSRQQPVLPLPQAATIGDLLHGLKTHGTAP